MSKSMNIIKITTHYERLFRDEELQGESNSNTNQKNFLEATPTESGTKLIKGYSLRGHHGKAMPSFFIPTVAGVLPSESL